MLSHREISSRSERLRAVPVGARLMVTFLKEDGTVAGKSEPFAEGWNENGYYLGRPVDVAQLHERRSPTGSRIADRTSGLSLPICPSDRPIGPGPIGG